MTTALTARIARPPLDGYASPPLARAVPHPRRPPTDGERVGLTSREREVLTLAAQGATAVSRGHLVRISPSIVPKHLEHAQEKLGADDRLVAVHRARALGLLALPSRH